MERYKRATAAKAWKGGPYSTKANVNFDFTRLKHPTWPRADEGEEEHADAVVDKYS
jgi:hypothetical protein